MNLSSLNDAPRLLLQALLSPLLKLALHRAVNAVLDPPPEEDYNDYRQCYEPTIHRDLPQVR